MSALALRRTALRAEAVLGRGARVAPLRASVRAPTLRFSSSSSSSIKPFSLAPGTLRAHHGPRARPSHEISDLGPDLIGQRVVLAGWLHAQRRASDKLHFFTLRTARGQVQLVVRDAAAAAGLMAWPLESVVQVEGVVIPRKSLAKDASAAWDAVEVELTQATLLNPADALPFYPNRPGQLVNEELRQEYRFLDLRRDELAANLRTRSEVAHVIRTTLHELGFVEVETPVLLNSSPEGAREFLVPTRVSAGDAPAFYALPQSPQQPKQLLVASGAVDKYYQIARCFRDEDGRKDRQPEFTQVDVEMAFVDGAAPQTPASTTPGDPQMRSTWTLGGAQVRDVVETLIKRIWKQVKGVDLEGWFRVMPYDVAMDVYGSDKPDTRYEMYTLPIGYYPTLSDASLDKVLLDQSPSTVEWMVTPKKWADGLDVAAIAGDNQFIDYVRITPENTHSWLAESVLTLPLGLQCDPSLPGGVEPGDIVWLSRRPKLAEGGWTQLGRLRVQIMDMLVEKDIHTLPTTPHFLWITNFPLFTHADEDKAALSRGRWASTHHPFTAPVAEDLAELEAGKPERVRGQHYDLVLDGQEIGGGSVRIHDAKLQEYVMRDVLQLDDDEMSRFDHLLRALKCGAPPHGGIALGFDRLVATLVGAKSIRDVIAFPKTGSGVDPVFKSPSVASADVLKEYGLKAAAGAAGKEGRAEEAKGQAEEKKVKEEEKGEKDEVRTGEPGYPIPDFKNFTPDV